MSDRSPDSTHRHPTDERTADQSTQSAGGLGTTRHRPGPEDAEDLLNRNEQGRYDTPRQYGGEDDAEETQSRKP